MAKAILVMDMPETCYECPFLNETDNCLAMDVSFTDVEVVIEKPKWCPLRDVPKKVEQVKREHSFSGFYYAEGYNACIDEIGVASDEM